MTRVNNMNVSNSKEIKFYNNNDKYYYIKSRNLAVALGYMTGQSYYILDDRYNRDNKFYSFENTDILRRALTTLTEFKNDKNNINIIQRNKNNNINKKVI